jgi:hypothetical protein
MLDCDAVQEFLSSGRGVIASETIQVLYQASTPEDVLEILRDEYEDDLKDIILQLLVMVDDLQDQVDDDDEANSFGRHPSDLRL